MNMDRRTFLGTSLSCAAHLGLLSAGAPAGVRRRFAANPWGGEVLSEPWARIEKVGDGIWAVISTPLAGGDNATRTFSNGGIIAGRNGVLVVEGFASDAGAAWLADSARQLAGKPPTHVVLTHYHGDHSAGLAGYQEAGAGPVYVTTETTRGLLKKANREPVLKVLEHAELVPVDSPKPVTFDLGGKKVLVTPRDGHTPSDLSVSVDDPPVVFGGDLLWNGLFPNYVDAIPSKLSQSVRDLARQREATFIPGHGSIPTAAELADYVSLLGYVEEAGRRAFKAGSPPEVAVRDFKLPDKLAKWVTFSDKYYEVALRAWTRELGGK